MYVVCMYTYRGLLPAADGPLGGAGTPNRRFSAATAGTPRGNLWKLRDPLALALALTGFISEEGAQAELCSETLGPGAPC